VAEQRAREPLFTGTFGTLNARQRGYSLAALLDVAIKNVANTNVLCWGGGCWAMFEAGQPYRQVAAPQSRTGKEAIATAQQIPLSVWQGGHADSRSS
jgi:all-trans-8'-apo-beta-carotenal 15,15'-oxygenase